MKTLLVFVVSMLLISCGPLSKMGVVKFKPPRGVRRQWVDHLPDGTYKVTTIHGFETKRVRIYECRPDSVTLAGL